MLTSLTVPQMGGATTTMSPTNNVEATDPKMGDMQKRFEQMLWAEMLSHSGLEDALTKSGGEAAAPFARYVVEAVAKDIAEAHPLGLSTAAKPALIESKE